MARTDNVDDNVVGILMSGQLHVLGRRPRYADKLAACKLLAADGYTDAQIGTLIGLSQRSVIRMRAQHDIRSVNLGLNGYTRRHATPNPLRSRKGHLSGA